MVIDGVDHGANRSGWARLVGNMGTSTVLSVRGLTNVSFVEFPADALNTITVYANRDDEVLWQPRFVAVHSRHTAIFGTPTPSQGNGSCAVLE